MATPSVGQRLSYDGAICTVRYVGPVAGTSGGLWLGVEWDDPSRGKHDGVHKGVRYFSCQLRQVAGGGGGAAATASYTAASTAASFVRPTRPADRTRTFLEAVRDKYASTEAPSTTSYRFSGKVAEEVGFEKVRRQMAQLESLRVVILDSMCLDRAGDDDREDQPSIRETCPCIAELDLGRNLFTSVRAVADICRQLPDLRSLRLNNNRFRVDDDSLAGTVNAVRELSVEETLLPWLDISRLTACFPALVSLKAGANQLSTLPLSISAPSLPLTLTTLSLEFNGFTALADLASLAGLPVLHNLHLKGNSIATVQSTTSENKNASLSFSPSIHYVDLAYNRVASWDFVDDLADVFPGLSSLRLAHNPVYDNPALDDSTAASDSSGKSSRITSATASAEEAYMITVARLAGLRTLNFSTVTPTDRANAEMFYLSRIARQMAAVPEGPAETAVVGRHRRFSDLCALYGEPAVIRRADVNPAFLEARLVTVLFSLAADPLQQQLSVQIPRSFDMYAVKGIVGRLFGTPPQKMRLVWETGEWDPVTGIDDDEADGEAGEDEIDAEAAELEAERAKAAAEAEMAESGTPDATDTGHHHGNKTGRWIKREVELKDSPRQFGFCVEGVQARIRVEVR
ncbi:tubulin-specific chaperone [Grosmannia clavigera kw1407]|uniref:Tubulin-specific chaperone n=1 Tax=Grosmannia clavigera (strain kw1407 / UAMH 11150) TaxID=655863 RepID=F0XDR2_GROCL|nr:tubulin-specific chaperone [Grosmannia clavigera kw1407]EFX03843.1 tubulin-specific chaperone [Grosmannia clavigera kw1407]